MEKIIINELKEGDMTKSKFLYEKRYMIKSIRKIIKKKGFKRRILNYLIMRKVRNEKDKKNRYKRNSN